MDLPYQFGKYRLVKKIAQGGMAEVYLAKFFGEGRFSKDVAVKRILPRWAQDKEFVSMLFDEAEALVRLAHQNIVSVVELTKDKDTYCIVMEYVDGIDLGKLINKKCKNSGIPLQYACYIIMETLKGLHFAHSKEIIHRDISPQNILVSSGGVVKVADFGIAKGSHRSFETIVSQVKGKFAYMSPEQASGEKIDQRSDLYSLGIVFYELLTGKRFHLQNDWEDDLPIGVRPIVRKTLNKDKEKRYESAIEFLREMTEFVYSNRLAVTGIDFGNFVKECCVDEICSSEIIPAEGTKTKRETIKKSRGSIFYGWFLVAFLVLTVLFSLIKYNPPVQAVSVSPQPQSVDLPKIPDVQFKEDKKIASKNESSFGQVSINARPWAYVFIKGYLEKKETPIYNLRLGAGEYLVKFYFEPQNKWLEKRIAVSGNSKLFCLADFENKKSVRCR